MVFHVGGTRPRWGAWLRLHLLLWTAWVTTEGGECRAGIPGVENSAAALLCPGPSDSADAQFFCGTCSAPSCCSWEVARLDQAQCPAGQRTRPISPAPPRRSRTLSQADLPNLELVILILVAMLLLGLIGFGFRYCVPYICRRVRRGRESRDPNRNDFELQAVQIPSLFEYPHAYEADEPRYTEAPHGPRVLPPTPNGPPVAQPGWRNAGYQEDETRPSRPPKPAWATGGWPPSQPFVSRVILSPGVRPQTSALAGCGPPTDCSGPTPSRVEDSYCPRSNPWACSAAQANPRGRLGAVSDVPPRPSAMASPPHPSPEDPPPDSVAVSHGLEVSPRALDTPPGVQFQCAAAGAEEMILGSLLGARPVDSVFEPVMKVNKLNLPITRL